MEEELKCKVCGKLASEDCHFYPRQLLCNRHYLQIHRHGRVLQKEEIHPVKIKDEDKICAICGDTNSSKYYIWHNDDEYKNQIVCSKHYTQMRAKGKAIDTLPSCKDDSERVCQVCGSTNKVKFSPMFNGVYCLRHYSQLYNLGGLKEETVFEPNKYILYDDRAEIILKNRKFEEVGRAIIDVDDLEKVLKKKWHLSSWGYAETGNGQNGSIMMQRYILDTYDSDKIIDHINLNTLDNRKTNLRIANKSENAMNSGISSSNTSGVRGVSWDKYANAWRSYITKAGVRYELGHTKNFDEAVKKRLCAEKEMFGDFAPQKHLYEEYNIA